MSPTVQDGDKPPPVPTHRRGRHMARLAAVQALYQMEMTGVDAPHVTQEFIAHRFAGEIDGLDLSEADTGFFRAIVQGVVHRQVDIDNWIDEALAAGWTLGRIDSILRALLRAAVHELASEPGVPSRTVITEYLDVAHAFFSGEEPRFANAVIDRIARSLRPGELTSGPAD